MHQSQTKRTVRAILVTPTGKVLLLKFRDPATDRTIWLTPGGGLLSHETEQEALRRELAEETGGQTFEIGPPVLRRQTRFLWAGLYHSQDQVFHVVRTEPFDSQLLDEHEATHFVEARWWTTQELRLSDENVDPPELAQVVDCAVTGTDRSIDIVSTARADKQCQPIFYSDWESGGIKSGTQLHQMGATSATQDIMVLGLKSEGSISPERISVRKELVRQLRQAPDSYFAYWQILALEVGCRHACAFCAQETGTTRTSFTKEGLEDILSALLTVATESRGVTSGTTEQSRALVGYGFAKYRSGIIKLSHDNDPGDSPLLAHTIRYIHEDFGMKSRLSMVAYSRHDEQLQRMHEEIVHSLEHAVDSVRFSFSAHPLGWRKNREDYLLDFANMLRTWRPFVDNHRGAGRYHGAITEFRMDPHVEALDEPLDDEFVLGHHTVRFGPALLISAKNRDDRPAMNTVTGVEGRSATFRESPQDYVLYVSDAIIQSGDWRAFASAMICRRGLPSVGERRIESWDERYFFARRGGLVLLANCDGPFYAFEPVFRPDGSYEALNVYPRTQTRKRSGIFNEVRWELNALLRYKAKVGVGRRERFPSATWEHVQGFVDEIVADAELTRRFDKKAAKHIEQKILPVVSGYIEVLKHAGYPPEFVFDPNFTYLAGPLYNLGRARGLFNGLVSRTEEPITASEMREYYLTYQFHPPTKLSPIPLLLDGESPTVAITGTKYPRAASGAGGIVFEQLNRIGMQPATSLYINGLVQLTRLRPSERQAPLG